RLQPGRGFEAGLGIVIVAIILDRVMQQFGEQKQ
ncbi:MAG: proline/glycine betaine ABC transporter permease, partial [Thermodesulfobacteriota bacterium]|nr:proline/glycine betaine ABC transporter permease [Thermodesulfobacteriota bacterium]